MYNTESIVPNKRFVCLVQCVLTSVIFETTVITLSDPVIRHTSPARHFGSTALFGNWSRSSCPISDVAIAPASRRTVVNVVDVTLDDLSLN